MRKALYSIIDFFPDKNQLFNFMDYFFSLKTATILGIISGILTFIVETTDVWSWLLSSSESQNGTSQATPAISASDFLAKWFTIFLIIIIITQLFSFIKKWNEVKEKNKLLEEVLKYSSRLTQNNTIHLTHTDKSFNQYEFSNLIIHDIYSVTEELKNNNKLTASSNIDDIRFLLKILSTKMVTNFDKIYCKGLKNFLKNILKDNKFAMKELLDDEIYIRLYFYSSDARDKIYSSFVDDELFFSESSLNHKTCYEVSDERFQEIQNPKTNDKLKIDKHRKIMFRIGSDNIVNCETEFYGFMEYDFKNSSVDEKDFLNNDFMQNTIKSLSIVIIEQLSYNMRVVHDNMTDIRVRALKHDDNLPNEDFDFLKTIYDNF
ncbi:hypothetical protein V9664_03885 [Streptococcus suis]|uniref:hypothetical protein n=2 Tax=Streptococcus suis TaxID=1307 RepID=UPI002A7D79B0|nr:hypothetical protein [Streptococcus suis]